MPINGTVTDIDGNVNDYISIGNQTWTIENLKTTRYRYGDLIPNITDSVKWGGLATGAYCWYDNDSATYKADYGALYNWFAVADSRNIAPIGWHVPSDVEWEILTAYLGGENIAGGKMKETGTTHWTTPNTGATNSIGFSALPGGFRDERPFANIGIGCFWWSSLMIDESSAWYRELGYDHEHVIHFYRFKQYGYNVRCARD